MTFEIEMEEMNCLRCHYSQNIQRIYEKLSNSSETMKSESQRTYRYISGGSRESQCT